MESQENFDLLPTTIQNYVKNQTEHAKKVIDDVFNATSVYLDICKNPIEGLPQHLHTTYASYIFFSLTCDRDNQDELTIKLLDCLDNITNPKILDELYQSARIFGYFKGQQQILLKQGKTDSLFYALLCRLNKLDAPGNPYIEELECCKNADDFTTFAHKYINQLTNDDVTLLLTLKSTFLDLP